MQVRVRVTPAARREKLEEKDGELIVSVKELAAGNRANVRVREMVAAHFSLPFGKVRLLTGHRSRSKLLNISR